MVSDVDAFVGRRLRRRRRLLGMTQQELAQACGVCFQQVQKYECAQTRLSVAMLWKLAGALQVDMAYFFVGLAEQPPQPSGRGPYDAVGAAARRTRDATPAVTAGPRTISSPSPGSGTVALGVSVRSPTS